MGGAAPHFGVGRRDEPVKARPSVATLPVHLNALAGYNVRRHRERTTSPAARTGSGQIYRALGLDVGVDIPEVFDYEAKERRTGLT